jgi:hypothetical protein
MAKRPVKTETEGKPVRFALNKVARGWFEGMPGARVRIEKDTGTVYILPSNRTKGIANLPDANQMIELSANDSGIRFTIRLDEQLEKGTVFILEPMSYKWYKMVPVEGDVAPSKEDGVARVVG